MLATRGNNAHRVLVLEETRVESSMNGKELRNKMGNKSALKQNSKKSDQKAKIIEDLK